MNKPDTSKLKVPIFPFHLALPQQRGEIGRALHGQLRQAILQGRLPAGWPLPASRKAAEQLGIARNTVTKAYELLRMEGYVVARQGANTVVADTGVERTRRQSAGARPREDSRLNPLWKSGWAAPPPPMDAPDRSFRLGVPEHRLFPHDAWRRLWARTLRSWSREAFLYAPTEGLPELREAIAQHVALMRAVTCTAEEVVVTSGAQQAFHLIARALVTAGQTVVAVEEPGYPPLRAAFAAAGARLVPVPVDAEGLQVQAIPADARVICVAPSHQMPTGVAMSLRRRAALLAFARARGAVILEDDYDGEFRYSGRPVDALKTLDRDALVFYVGTFSKTLFPALRKGYVVAPPWARDALVAAKHCIDPNSDALTQAMLSTFVREGHLVRHIRRMTPVYEARRAALLVGIERELDHWLEPIASCAGLHVAARVRAPASADVVLQVAREHAPGVQTVANFALDARRCMPALAFGFGAIDEEEITTALQRIRRGLARRLPPGSPGALNPSPGSRRRG